MKKLILIIILLTNANIFAQIQPDKYYHAGAGCIIASSMYTVGQYSEREMNPIAPALVSLTAGFFKEGIDAMSGRQFNSKDLIWTTASGIVTNVVIRAIWKPKRKVKHTDDIFLSLK